MGTSCPYGGTVTASLDPSETILTVELDPILDDQECFIVDLLGVDFDPASDTSFEIRPLQGDVNRDGIVSTADASIVKAHFGETPDDSTAHFDVNSTGVISAADFWEVKPFFGNVAPECQ